MSRPLAGIEARRRKLASWTFALGVAGALGLAPALAQQSGAVKKSAPAKAESAKTGEASSEEMQSIWAKLCGETTDPKDAKKKLKVCTTQFEVLNKEAVPVLAGAVTHVEGQPQELFSVTVPQGPQGIAIRPGVRVKIDGGEAIPLRYTFCFVHGCMAEAPATSELVESLKAGKAVVIGLYDTAGRVLSLPVPLEGFDLAHKGPAIDPKRYVELRQKMIEDYRKQAAEGQAAPASAKQPKK